MYKTTYFKAYELVDKTTYTKFGEGSFRFFNVGLLKLIDELRRNLGPATINNWYWKGESEYDNPSTFRWSGLRTPESEWYRTYSRHSHGCAVDMRFTEHSAEEVREWIRNNYLELLSTTGLTSITIENDVNWVHIQVDNKEFGLHSFNV